MADEAEAGPLKGLPRPALILAPVALGAVLAAQIAAHREAILSQNAVLAAQIAARREAILPILAITRVEIVAVMTRPKPIPPPVKTKILAMTTRPNQKNPGAILGDGLGAALGKSNRARLLRTHPREL